jgi:hypothetical protein
MGILTRAIICVKQKEWEVHVIVFENASELVMKTMNSSCILITSN